MEYTLHHTGDIYRLSEELKIQERKVIDFSCPVNPLGVSKKIKAEIRKYLRHLHNYPDPETRRLRRRLAQYHGIDADTILCGNGSTELIYLMIQALKPKKILIPEPTYSEYERACQIHSPAQITTIALQRENNFDIDTDVFIHKLEKELPSFEIAFICNPNNPTGRLLKKEDVKRIAHIAKEIRCYLVVDEAFMDFCPEESVVREVEGNPYLIVLRTFAHFYALPGLRIGYGVFPRQLISRIREQKEPWTVNSLAQRASVIGLKDKVYRRETFQVVEKEKQFLEKGFKKLGIAFIPSSVNFYLLNIDNADEISIKLREKGILIRECSDFKGLDNTYVRISVKSHKENTILIKELTAILQK